MRPARALLALRLYGLLMLVLGPSAVAQPRAVAVVRRDQPCPGCVLRLPKTPLPAGRTRPLVVALHGDNGAPTRLVELLAGEADRRGFAVLALACPQKLGCTKRSFWQWGGAPSFLAAQVETLLAATGPGGEPAWAIDRQRVYLLGWSGGASYLTDVMAELPARFAAVALLGGGMPSRYAGRCARCLIPIYYAVGDRNPLAALARAARDALRTCGHPLHFAWLKDTDHAGEWAAFQQGKLAEVLTFFSEHSLTCRE